MVYGMIERIAHIGHKATFEIVNIFSAEIVGDYIIYIFVKLQ